MRNWYGTAALALLGLVVAFLFQGTHGLYEPSEGRYAEAAREMLDSGNYLEPTLDFRPHWTKPPMTYWAAAAGFGLLGRNAWGARFFNAIALCLTALFVAATGSRLWDRRTGFLAGIVYLSSPFPVLGASFLTTDTLLTLWEVLAVLAFVMSWRAASQPATRWWNRAMWLFFGLGFFTKGPPALFPLLPLIVFFATSPKRRVMFDALGVVLFLVSAGWWYLMVSVNNPGVLGYFVRDEILGRNLTDQFRRNSQWWAPFAIYVPALLFGLGPWLVEAVRGWRSEFRGARAARLPLWGLAGTPHRFVILWIVIPLLVFSISKSRLILYVLPFHAPLALATAAVVARRTRRRSIVALAAVSIVLCLGAKASISLFNRQNNAKLVHAAAVSAGGSDAHYILLDEPRLYGVQFYFDGRIERVSLAGREPWANRDLSAVVADVASVSFNRRYVFITHTAGARAIEDAFGYGGLLVSRTQAYGREIVVVGAGGRPPH